MIKVALVDDHVVVRSGFAQLMSLEPDIEIVGQFSSCAEARNGLPGSGATVCILDISMPDESGLSLLQDLPSGIHCIMLSVHDSVTMVENALKAGARGYLSKRCSPDELLQAVRTTANNGCYLTPDIALKLASSKNSQTSLDYLTNRERQVGEMLARGMDVKVVAAELGLSHKTVHVHRANMMSKLGVTNNVGLVNYFTTSDL
ncbi:transcriptional regulator UhpA [Xenorhabdus bovienii]|uniref:Transcriptional regulatory protein UhpA n=4 Tax=Xenorhabdus bovienii TaxID=40576 RepID=A0A0B6X968_XENBV|nr:transcriptional regulator UhpA [Xenorhabdus bovienii]CDG98455.1 response regulator (activator) in two-component regulatory system wtih UhpB, regulates uhpT expression (LuxR/UhpA family) [Xenorhabdus bovienii str. puntauvense]CDH01790.1 response regulator (activator) in two-component regulatory system wtih UhpB, regulates uhpT expression (LuxR/UhpA family) [Xenorhabdus bovienii str. feltiae Moldova]CDH23274.1 response regulator (activator) in two-component regulatory system wtih UhpB, regulate